MIAGLIPHTPKELSDNDVANLEKIAQLRGELGILISAVKDALDQMQPQSHGYDILKRALEP